MILKRKVFTSATVTVLISVLTFGFVAPIFAQDLSDNETCLECHADDERVLDEPSAATFFTDTALIIAAQCTFCANGSHRHAI